MGTPRINRNIGKTYEYISILDSSIDWLESCKRFPKSISAEDYQELITGPAGRAFQLCAIPVEFDEKDNPLRYNIPIYFDTKDPSQLALTEEPPTRFTIAALDATEKAPIIDQNGQIGYSWAIAICRMGLIDVNDAGYDAELRTRKIQKYEQYQGKRRVSAGFISLMHQNVIYDVAMRIWQLSTVTEEEKKSS